MKKQLIFENSWYKKLLPIQSLRQLTDSILISLAVGLIFTQILFPWPNGLLITTVFAWVGILPVMSFVLKSELKIEDINTQIWIKNIQIKLKKDGYFQLENSTNHCLRFEVNLPKILKWKESNVYISIGSNTILIKGPILILRSIDRFIDTEPSH